MSTVPPCGASTRAAALASCSAKFTVIGCSPTLPRTPSVPKYRRAKFLTSPLDCRHHLQGIHGGGDVVRADDARAAERRPYRERQAPVEALTTGAPCQCADHRLARQAGEQRHPEVGQPRQPAQQCQVVLEVFAKTEARIDEEPVIRDTGRTAGVEARAQELC